MRADPAVHRAHPRDLLGHLLEFWNSGIEHNWYLLYAAVGYGDEFAKEWLDPRSAECQDELIGVAARGGLGAPGYPNLLLVRKSYSGVGLVHSRPESEPNPELIETRGGDGAIIPDHAVCSFLEVGRNDPCAGCSESLALRARERVEVITSMWSTTCTAGFIDDEPSCAGFSKLLLVRTRSTEADPRPSLILILGAGPKPNQVGSTRGLWVVGEQMAE
ncbi:hypothetical protein K438DRAFT_1789040 [Mycena galopus ATCC 62051]|nr:hypothetical protein K438DRAFT_1789040 [Mycena galopus ATCC 62051]